MDLGPLPARHSAARRRVLVLAGAVLPLLALGGCVALDPPEREPFAIETVDDERFGLELVDPTGEPLAGAPVTHRAVSAEDGGGGGTLATGDTIPDALRPFEAGDRAVAPLLHGRRLAERRVDRPGRARGRGGALGGAGGGAELRLA